MDIGASVSALTSIPLDWLILAVIFIVLSADAVRSGPAHACAISIAFPITLFLFQMLSGTFILGGLLQPFQGGVAQGVLFAITLVLLFVCFNQMLYAFDRSTSLLSSALVGFAATIVLVTVWLQSPALLSLWHFDPQMQAIFGTAYRFFWLLGAYLALAFVSS